jgi:hypothetical protein
MRGWLVDLDGHEQPVNQMDLQSPVGRSLAPHESRRIAADFVSEGLSNSPLPFRVRGFVDYRGVASWTYRTEFEAEWRNGQWSVQGRKMTLSPETPRKCLPTRAK